MKLKLPAVAGRAGWTLADQIIVSVTNTVLSVLVANSVDAQSFGGFALAFTVFALVIGFCRAVATSPLGVRFSDVPADEAARAARAATGASITIGFVVGIGCVLTGLLFDGSLRQALVALGVVLPVLTVSDAYRYVFFSTGRPSASALNDGLWGVVQLAAVAVLIVVGSTEIGLLVLAWGTSAVAAALLAVRQSRSWPDPRRTVSWLREHVDHTGYMLANFVTAQGCNQGAILVIAAIGSQVDVGSLRGTQILLGPTSILASAAFSFAVPEFVRRRKGMTQRGWVLGALAVSGFVAGLGFFWGSIFLLAPEALGEAILAETWAGTSEILFAAVVTQIGSAATVGAVVMLFAMDRASSTLTIQIVTGVLTFGLGVGGMAFAGAIGAQWGFAIAAWVVVPFWFLRLWREIRRRESGREAMLPDPDDITKPPAMAQPGRLLEDVSPDQMPTMYLPRIAPRPAPIRPGPGRPAHPGLDGPTLSMRPARRPVPPTGPAGPPPHGPNGRSAPGGVPPLRPRLAGRPVGPPRPSGPPPNRYPVNGDNGATVAPPHPPPPPPRVRRPGAPTPYRRTGNGHGSAEQGLPNPPAPRPGARAPVDQPTIRTHRQHAGPHPSSDDDASSGS